MESIVAAIASQDDSTDDDVTVFSISSKPTSRLSEESETPKSIIGINHKVTLYLTLIKCKV